MDISQDIKDFLMTRRAKITPDQVGLPTGSRRRVAGLRREEVAMLAGVSAEYYVQIERGHVAGVSDEVLHAVAGALQLDETETSHLFDLARAAARRPGRRPPRRQSSAGISPALQGILDALVGAPAFVQNGHLDVLATNALGAVLYADVVERASVEPPNLARFVFLDERAAELFPQWDRAADDVVALLRVEAGRSPFSRDLTDLVGELATRSEEFRVRWASHDVRAHRRGMKTFHHRAVGELTLRYEGLVVDGSPGTALYAFTAEPGTPAHDALQLLASWGATTVHPANSPEPTADTSARLD